MQSSWKFINNISLHLVLCTLHLAPVFSAEPQAVQFKTKDNITLKGEYCPPAKGKNVLILLHGLGSGKYEWKTLADTLTKEGWGVLTYDLRGHGASAQRKNEYQLYGRPGRGSPWHKMIDDVGAAKQFLKTQRNIPSDIMVFGGASLGANLALNYVALTGSAHGLLLLSPGWNYRGIEAHPSISQLKKIPTLIVASPNDTYSYRSSIKMKEMNPSVQFWSNVPPGHGVQMFDDALLKRITKWLNNPN